MTLIALVRCAIASLVFASTRAVYLPSLTRVELTDLKPIRADRHFSTHLATIRNRHCRFGASSMTAESHIVWRDGHFIPRGRSRLAAAF